MIRPAESTDASSIAEILVSAWQTAYTGVIDPEYPGSLSTDKYTVLFKKIRRDQSQVVFVYEENSVVTGFASGVMPDSEYDCEVKGLYVDPLRQGRGTGSLLLNHMKEHFTAAGCESMIIRTLLGVKNNGFYMAHGGLDKERKTIEIGAKRYPGIGYCFHLKQ